MIPVFYFLFPYSFPPIYVFFSGRRLDLPEESHEVQDSGGKSNPSHARRVSSRTHAISESSSSSVNGSSDSASDSASASGGDGGSAIAPSAQTGATQRRGDSPELLTLVFRTTPTAATLPTTQAPATLDPSKVTVSTVKRIVNTDSREIQLDALKNGIDVNLVRHFL